jgi:hypothetical protein
MTRVKGVKVRGIVIVEVEVNGNTEKFTYLRHG